MKELDNIINRAYDLFSCSKLIENLDACNECCLSKEEELKIKSTLREDISLELLIKYQNAAKPKKLSIVELKHFIPRYFELINNHQYPSINSVLSLTRFGYFNKSDWTNEEWNLLSDFALLFFKNHLNSDINALNNISTIEVLLMFYKGNFNIHDMLKEWEIQSSDESVFSFNELLDGIDFNSKNGPKVRDAFSDELFNEIICDWVLSSKVKIKFKKEFEKLLLNLIHFG